MRPRKGIRLSYDAGGSRATSQVGAGIVVCACVLIGIAAQPLAALAAWQRHTIDATSSGADGVRLGDANGDGLQDVTTGWEEGGLVRVYLNPGPRNAKQPWPAVTVGRVERPEDAVLVDLDGDGAADVVSSTEGKRRTVYVHWAPGQENLYLDERAWRTEPIPATAGRQGWMFALPMQVDGERGIDLVVGSKNKDASVSWLRSPAEPRDLSAWTLHRIEDADWIMSLHEADVDGDGRDDVLVSDRGSQGRPGMYWLRANGDVLERRDIGAAGVEPMFLDARDLTGDGRVDVIAATRSGRILGFVGGATWTPFDLPNPFGAPDGKSVAIGDIDGDGRMDLVHAANTHRGGQPGVAWVRFASRFGQGPSTEHDVSGPEGSKFDRVELIDLDADGDLDVLTCEENAGPLSRGLGVVWYENPGKGPVATPAGEPASPHAAE